MKIGNIAHPFLVTLWFDGTGTVMQSEKNLWTHFRFRHDDNRKVNNMFLDGHVETWTDTDAMNPDFEFYLLPKGDVPYLQAPYQSPHYPYHPFRQAE